MVIPRLPHDVKACAKSVQVLCSEQVAVMMVVGLSSLSVPSISKLRCDAFVCVRFGACAVVV